MNGKELITKLAREAGLYDVFGDGNNWQSQVCPSVAAPDLERFAALVAEECARICDSRSAAIDAGYSSDFKADAAASAEADSCAQAIRDKFAQELDPERKS